MFATTVCLAAALLRTGIHASAQDSNLPATAPSGDFFSGVILSFSTTELTVNRKGLGKDSAVTKTFSIDSATKVEGALKAKAHVTVRFMATEGGARAVHIIVR